MDSLREDEILNNHQLLMSSHQHDQQGLIFANRMKSIPVVFSTCFWLNESYQRIKEINFLTKTTCQLAESTLNKSIDLVASPLLTKFKNQVELVDSIACTQLDRIEAAFPVIRADTNNMYEKSKRFINDLKVKPKNKTRHLISKMLDLSEKFIETNLIYNELLLLNGNDMIKDNNQINTLIESNDSKLNYNYELIRLYKAQKEEFKKCNSNLEVCSLSNRTKLLTLVTYNIIQYKLLNQLNNSFKIFKEYFLNLFQIIETFKMLKQAFALNLKDKFHVTKDKIDLYKEYLDVLSKQFTVQDGRSLDHVHSLEERTKIIIRRSIGNLLTAYSLISSRIKHLEPILQQKFNSIRQFLLGLYQVYNKNDGIFNEQLVESLIRESKDCLEKIQLSINNSIKAINESTKNLDWLVPNFDAFGVLDESYSDEEEDAESNFAYEINNDEYPIQNKNVFASTIRPNSSSSSIEQSQQESMQQQGMQVINGGLANKNVDITPISPLSPLGF